MKGKKGAIELSMSTIIVIILGIALLTLGLMWIRGNITHVIDLSNKAFELSDQQISTMFQDSSSLLNIMPDYVDLKQGDSAIVGVLFSNSESGDIKIKAKASPVASGITCNFEDTLSGVSKEYTLKSGGNQKLKLVIESKKNTPLGHNSCEVKIISDLDTIYSTYSTVSVNIIQK